MRTRTVSRSSSGLNDRMMEIIRELKNKKIDSFHAWCVHNFDQVVDSIHHNRIMGPGLIAQAMGWDLPIEKPGGSQRGRHSLRAFAREWNTEQWIAVVKAAMREESKLENIPRTLYHLIDEFEVRPLIQQSLGLHKRGNSWSDMSGAEIVEYLTKNNLKKASDVHGMNHFLQNPKNSEKTRVVYEYFLLHVTRPCQRTKIIKAIERTKASVRNRRPLRKHPTARELLNQFVSYYGNGDPFAMGTTKLYYRIAARASKVCARENFHTAAQLYLGALVHEERGTSMDYLYAFRPEHIKSLIDIFEIHQGDLRHMPGFFRFLMNKGLAEYVPGSEAEFQWNVCELESARRQERLRR